MKKKLVASLAAAMVLGVAGTSFAASNPFVDVPAKHWAYDAVTKLSQAGIVDGYGDGRFQGDKMISRYEMAQIVAKAMAKSDKADPSQKALIEKLSTEFANELEGLNVRVDKVEKKVSLLDKVQVAGAARIRYDHAEVDSIGASGQNINMDINYTYKVNDEWSIKGESEFQRNLRNTDTNSGNSGSGLNTTIQDQMEQLYVTGPIGATTLKAGKLSYTPTYGVVFDNKVSGAQVSFGDKLKTTLTVGKTNNFYGNDLQYQAADFAWAYSKDTNFKANYQKLKDNANVSNHWYELGFDTKLSKDYVLQAAYAKSSHNADNKAYLAQVQYKAADVNVINSRDVYVKYSNFELNGTIDTAADFADIFKGVTIGYDYVPAKNIKLGTFYMSGKETVTNTDMKVFRAQAELFF